MEIKNGFIRSCSGTWFSVVGLDRIEVTPMKMDLRCSGHYWKIDGVWINDGKNCRITLDDKFEIFEEAQSMLDKIMTS